MFENLLLPQAAHSRLEVVVAATVWYSSSPQTVR